MSDTVARFSNRAENYAKYRPNYPTGVVDILKTHCGLTDSAVIADVGSGTGILTEMFLRNGNPVFGIEPNSEMRTIAESALKGFPKFQSLQGSAEATTLDSKTVDLVTAAQAFHWFDRTAAKREFARILKPDGWVALIWNERKLDSTPFLRDYEEMLLKYGTDYDKVRHENVEQQIPEFFAPETYNLEGLENFQYFDFESLKGRVMSSSYTPAPGHVDFKSMMKRLAEIFAAHQKDGTVTFEYETRVFYGHLGDH